jgi:hypothetical protein
MSKLMRPIITVGLGSLLALFSAAISYSTPPAMESAFGVATFLVLQPTSTPKPKDLSEIGSTDGIVFMGILIALIIIIPILLRRKSWMESR